MTESKKILNLHAPFAKTGYGIAALNIAKSLSILDIDIRANVIGQPYTNSIDETKFVQKIIEQGLFFEYDAPTLKIWHQFALGDRMGRGPYFAMPIFELDTFKEYEKHHLKYVDNLIVNSKWAKDIILNNLEHNNISVVPLGVDTNIFSPSPKQRQSNTYVFLNAGKWEIRKGHDILVDIFNKAFSPNDDVELWLLTSNPFCTEKENKEWQRLYTNHPLGNKVRFIPPQTRHYDIAAIMKEADCGIFPSRAEGWNLELLEMMALGKPVITTNYSAHTEFCNKYNSYLTEITELESAYDGKWFKNDGNWAKITDKNITEMAEYMRFCYKERPINEGGIFTGQMYSWINTATSLKKVIWGSDDTI